jgi:hypothetical protein
MSAMLPRYLISVFIILALPVAVFGQSVATVKPGDPVPEARGYTYAELLADFIPGLEVQPDGAAMGEGGFALDHIEGEDWAQPAPETISVSHIGVLALESGDEPYLALLFDLGARFADAFPTVVLALYETTGEPRLVDVMEVGGDQWVSFGSPPLVATGAGDNALIVSSTHSNSSQSYASTSIITVTQGELGLVDTILTLGSLTCGVSRTQSLTIAANEIAPGPWPINATVTDTLSHLDEDCGERPIPEPFVKTYAVQYLWDAASRAYVAPADAWDELDAINGARF